MNETSPPAPAALGGASAGALLRAAREATGLHIAALAVSLKVPVRKIEALEADRWDELPDPVFVRALASSACRSLRVDPAPVLALLPPAPATRLPKSGPRRGVDLSAPAPSSMANWFRPLASAPIVAVLALLIAALAVYLWPVGGAVAPQPEPSKPVSPTSKLTEPVRAVEASALTPKVDSGQAGEPAASMPDPASPVLGSAAAMAVAEAAVPKSNPAIDNLPIVAFKAKGKSWVEVVDARQTVLMRRTFNPGESATAVGQLPLAVVIGRADAVDVQVRGQSFDAVSRSRDNVARFEVK